VHTPSRITVSDFSDSLKQFIDHTRDKTTQAGEWIMVLIVWSLVIGMSLAMACVLLNTGE
jgi:hypothetical protein